jgi:hypothetical protein
MLQRLPANHPERRGVCRALCMAYSGLDKIGSNIGTASGRGSDDRDKWEEALLQYSVKMQKIIDVTGATDILSGAIQTTKTCGKAVSLNVLDAECKTYQWNCTKEISTQVTALTSPGKYFQIWLPTHVICARMSDDLQTAIFDPNFGEARMPRDQFQKVLGLLLTHPTITQKYAMVAGTDIHVISTW